MFTSDLTVMADIGFPLTAQRIREELECAYNCDNIIEWAFDHGYTIRKNSDLKEYTVQANLKYKWTVKRTKPPYSDYTDTSFWQASTAKEAITMAYDMLMKSLKHNVEYNRYTLDTPPWVKS